MISDNKLYTWIDVQDVLQIHFSSADKKAWLKHINFRAYWTGLNITYSHPKNKEEVINELEDIFKFGLRQNASNYFIDLEGGRSLPIFLEFVESEDIDKVAFKPALGRPHLIAEQETYSLGNNATKATFYAFHSFKGGVGRTLHALALAIYLTEKNKKVLLIDADFEAPGISWLADSVISFADFLALIHGEKDTQSVIKQTAEVLKAETRENNKLFVLPAFRSLENKIPVLEVKPENIFQFNRNPFILTDVLNTLAIELEVDCVILDLRAGVSELSSSWFFDPRINKVFVTTLSGQSLLGTAMMFKTLARFEEQNNLKNDTVALPFVIVSQVPKVSIKDFELSWGDNYPESGTLSPLREAYKEAFIDIGSYMTKDRFKDLSDEQVIGEIMSSVTIFSEENENLKSLPIRWESVSNLIKQNGLTQKTALLTDVLPSNDISVMSQENFAHSRKKLEDVTKRLVFAEGDVPSDFLVTEPIFKLANQFRTQIPIAVVVGAKGSGKTFLYRQIVILKNWQDFGQKAANNSFENRAFILPVTKPLNVGFDLNLKEIPNDIKLISETVENKDVWIEYIKNDIEKSLKQDLTVSQWREKWLDYMAWSAGFGLNESKVILKFLELLKNKQKKIITVFDGLEDLFKQFNTDIHQQKALEALLQDVPNWLDSQPEKYLGVIVFVRKDIVTAAISQNSGQFLAKYNDFVLRWNTTEALRLVHWILNTYEIFQKPTFDNWQNTLNSKDEAELYKGLYKLWGMKMAKDKSNEAYSHSWILGTLANLNKEFQSRDIVRLLSIAAGKSTSSSKGESYSDRLLIPNAIKDAMQEVGREKIDEVKKENEPLKNVLEKLEGEITKIKFPCKTEDMNRICTTKEIETLTENGVIKPYEGEYYMAEIYRQGMGFEYSRRGRPKVLYL